MEYLDFSSVITLIRKYINDERTVVDNLLKTEVKIDQIHLLDQIFASFCDDPDSSDYAFDNGQVCRWFNGQARISPRIISYYMDEDKRKLLSDDMEYNVLPLMYDISMATQDAHTLLMQDTTISLETKNKLVANYPCHSDTDKAAFLADVLFFGMEREFRKRDVNTKALIASGAFSPLMRDFIFGTKVPRPCRHFCGRGTELDTLHKLLCSHGKVFLQGIAGIGKSELAKAYAKKYDKEYTNILYLTYSGDLRNDIANMDFADDTDDSETIDSRFSRHHRHLRKLKDDSLLIIDNFNTITAKDSVLDVIMKYHCHILFTTRSRFDNYTSMNLEEIADIDALVNLMGYFYSEAETNRSILEQIIETVHHHTLAIEMAARLLETGIMEPLSLLKKLKEEKAALDATDTIGISKDGKNRKATYYDHIHTLFSLYQLSEEETDIMRNLTLTPLTGVQNRVFANWMKLRDMNMVNDLIEKGFVLAIERRMIALHPMIQEVSIEETRPSIPNCRTLLNSIQEVCLRHGEEVSYYKQMFQTIENIIELIDKNDAEFYLRFIEDAFPYMQKFKYQSGMERIVDEMAALLKEKTFGTVSERALLLDYRAALEARLEKSIKYEKDAVELLKNVTTDNALLASNLHANLGGMYHMIGKQDLAKQYMEAGIHILEEYGLAAYHDSVPQIVNYSVLLTEMGEPQMGMSALKKLSRVVKEYNSNKFADYGAVQEAMANICLATGEIEQATTHYKKALAIYETVFEAEPELIEEKKQAILETYVQAGVYLGKKLLS